MAGKSSRTDRRPAGRLTMLAAVILAMIVVLAGCGGDPTAGDGRPASTSPTAQQPATSPETAAAQPTSSVEPEPAPPTAIETADAEPPPAADSATAPTAEADSAPEFTAGPAATPLSGSRPVRIQVPAIGADTSLLDLGLQADGTLEVPPDAESVGWFTGGPTPGQLGPAVVVGHVDWAGTRGVFYDLRDMQPGNEITITRADGSVAYFQVRSNEQFPKDQFPTAAVYGNLDHAGLRLITCGGSFDSAARSYLDNIVVFADLVGSTTA